MLRSLIAACLLALLVAVGAIGAGPVPPLGPLLEPAHGAWALARTGELPSASSATLPGLSATVDVRYDTRGVPHIFATTEEDAYRALGYVVARDRLFQLWIQTMAATGRLSEIAGPRALPLDREMRRLGLPRAAEQKLAVIDSNPETARLVNAYADGVNAYIDHLSPDELPLEFRLLRISQIPRWQPINSIHLFERMGWTLAYFTPELDRALAAARVGSAAAASLFPDNSPIQEPIQPNGRTAPRFDFTHLAPPGAPDTAEAPLVAAAIADFFPSSARQAAGGGDVRAFASNNWAVAGKRSATHVPLLAGDPHLELSLPSIWYEAHLVVPGVLDVYGVTIPGAPGIVIGFNRDVAWTFTNTGADVLDFYTEQVNDADRPTMYMVDGAWHPLEKRIETYRGTHDEAIAVDTVYYTQRGPLRHVGSRWLSMRWTVLEPSNEPAGFEAAAHARDVTEFQTAMGRYYKAPAQNMLVVDRRGSIAIRSTGRFPIRPGGGSGFVIRDGTQGANDWRGTLPVEFAPQSLNPAQGFLASANQQPIDPKVAPYWLGGLYDPWRAMRINQLLRADSAVTVDDMRRFQTDPGSARADFFVPYFLDAARSVEARPGASPDPVLRSAVGLSKLDQAAKLLKEWDRRYTTDDRRAVLFETAFHELVDRTWDELEVASSPQARARPAGGESPARVVTPSSPILAELLADPTNAWWDDRRTPGVEGRDDILAASLVAAFDETRARYGDPDGKKWLWGRIRHTNIWHPLHLRSLSALNLPVQGGPSTLNPSSGSGIFGSSWRMVVEAAPDGLRAWGTYPGGQSGNPASSRYENHLPEWLSGQLAPLEFPRWIPDLDAAHTASRLTLRAKE